MNAENILPTGNVEWGFWGTMGHHGESAEAWAIAMQAIGTATGCPDLAVRDFLDSRHGRHFADDVANGLFEDLSLPAAIGAVVNRWMA